MPVSYFCVAVWRRFHRVDSTKSMIAESRRRNLSPQTSNMLIAFGISRTNSPFALISVPRIRMFSPRFIGRWWTVSNRFVSIDELKAITEVYSWPGFSRI